MEKTLYTHTNIHTSYYSLPEDCNKLLAVKSLRYDEQYMDIDFINIYKGDKLVGFSLYKIYDAKVEKGISINYK